MEATMRTEILQAKGMLSDLKRKYSHLDAEASGLIALLRNLLNPWERDITKLPVAQIVSATSRLREVHEKMIELQKQISEIESAIGE